MPPIYFFSRRADEYAYLSNFHRAPIEVEGKVWPTVEHYYQAMKTPFEDMQELIRQAPNPAKAKKLGSSAVLRPDWEEVKEEVMLQALRAKFTQHEDLKEALLATGGAALHEDSPRDPYWGRRGRDRLGKLLMQIREEIAAGERG